MIKSQIIGQSPGAEGDSLRPFGGHPKGSAAGLRYKATEGCVPGGEIRGAAPQKNSSETEILSELDSIELAIAGRRLDLFTNRENRIFLRDIYERIAVQKTVCSDLHGSSLGYLENLSSELQRRIIVYSGAWWEDRMQLESVAGEKMARAYRFSVGGRISYYSYSLAIKRIPLLHNLSLVFTVNQARDLILEISELGWRPE